MPRGHERCPWLQGELEALEVEFARLSYDELRERLRTIYRRLTRELGG